MAARRAADAKVMRQANTEILVPASISNLGPGFDALSVAVELFLRVRVVEVLTSQPDVFETRFIGQRPGGDNRIEVAFRHACERLGRPASGLRIEAHTEIPMAAGLGSSAAATVAGLRLYGLVASPVGDSRMLALACEIEGHPDNAAAALLGGVTLSCQCDGGEVIARSWRWPSDIAFVVATPDFPLETTRARRALPGAVDLRDAVFNLQRALLLVRALETGSYGDLREALRDRWHQPARAPLVPGLAEALALDHPAVLGACLSGAGPSVAALAAPGRDRDAADALAAVYRRIGVPCTIRVLRAHQLRPEAAPALIAGEETPL